MVLDVWARLSGVFCIASSRCQPEILLGNLSPDTIRAILDDLLSNSREVNAALYTLMSRKQVTVQSQTEAIDKFVHGQLTGGFLIAPVIFGVEMPVLGIFNEGRGKITIDYEMGADWTPVALIVLFEYLRLVRLLEKDVTFQFRCLPLGRAAELQFVSTLEDYFNDTLA